MLIIESIYYPFPGLEDHPIDALEVAGAGCLIGWFGLETRPKTAPKTLFLAPKTAVFGVFSRHPGNRQNSVLAGIPGYLLSKTDFLK